jgi:hypothetical protein
MKLIGATSLFLLLITGSQGEVQAATAGSYRCVFPEGVPDASTDIPAGLSFTLPVVFHYNPTKITQSIRRIKAFDETGTLIFDSGAIPAGDFTVPPSGSTPLAVVSNTVTQGLQFIVNWSQSTDAAAPIPRANLFHIDQASTEVFSMAQTTCP